MSNDEFGTFTSKLCDRRDIDVQFFARLNMTPQDVAERLAGRPLPSFKTVTQKAGSSVGASSPSDCRSESFAAQGSKRNASALSLEVILASTAAPKA